MSNPVSLLAALFKEQVFPLSEQNIIHLELSSPHQFIYSSYFYVKVLKETPLASNSMDHEALKTCYKNEFDFIEYILQIRGLPKPVHVKDLGQLPGLIASHERLNFGFEGEESNVVQDSIPTTGFPFVPKFKWIVPKNIAYSSPDSYFAVCKYFKNISKFN